MLVLKRREQPARNPEPNLYQRVLMMVDRPRGPRRRHRGARTRRGRSTRGACRVRRHVNFRRRFFQRAQQRADLGDARFRLLPATSRYRPRIARGRGRLGGVNGWFKGIRHSRNALRDRRISDLLTAQSERTSGFGPHNSRSRLENQQIPQRHKFAFARGVAPAKRVTERAAARRDAATRLAPAHPFQPLPADAPSAPNFARALEPPPAPR